MPEHDLFVPCTIRGGGFSSERTFEIALPKEQKLVGLAYRKYVFDENMKPVDDDTPPKGQSLRGYVQCRVLRKIDADTVLIEVPSSDVIRFPASDLAVAG